MSEKVLRAIDIHKSYFMGNHELKVLKGIDLEVYEGEIVAIVGPSGVGKSTLLHIMGTLDRPTKGRIEIDSKDVFSLNDNQLADFRNKTVGFIFQFHHLLPEFTALENVAIPSLIRGANSAETWQRAKALLEEVGLSDRADHKPVELSGGEQQRVAVARALMNEPRIILADEPWGNLDLKASRSLHELLWRLSREKSQSLVVVTHNRELAEKADRIFELYDGKIRSF